MLILSARQIQITINLIWIFSISFLSPPPPPPWHVEDEGIKFFGLYLCECFPTQGFPTAQHRGSRVSGTANLVRPIRVVCVVDILRAECAVKELGRYGSVLRGAYSDFIFVSPDCLASGECVCVCVECVFMKVHSK